MMLMQALERAGSRLAVAGLTWPFLALRGSADTWNYSAYAFNDSVVPVYVLTAGEQQIIFLLCIIAFSQMFFVFSKISEWFLSDND